MTVAVVLARILLALVFAAAGSAKLIDQVGARGALAAFGAPPRIVAPAAISLSIVELFVSGALLLPDSARAAAALAFALLVTFSVAIANSLLHGRRPACHCFGQLSTSPTSWATIGRNLVLAAIAAFVVVAMSQDGESTAATYVTLAVLVGLATAVGLLLASRRLPWLSLTRLEERLVRRPRLLSPVSAAGRLARLAGTGAAPPRGLPVGSRAPDFSVRDANGSRMTLNSLLRAGSPAVLVFGASDCQPCVELMPTVLRWQHELRDRLTIALITSGSLEEWVAADTTPDDKRVLAQDNREVADAYKADVTPSAVLVSADGRIASRLAVGELPIQALVNASGAQTDG